MTNQTVLLIDDDEKLAQLLQEYLQPFNLNLISATLPSEGIKLLNQADLVLLDVMLPQMDGFETCRVIRQQSKIPIIMLTARGEVSDRIVGLEIGADDYLAKPFEVRELLARIKNLLRRTKNSQQGNRLNFGEMLIDKNAFEVLINDEKVLLTNMEFQLLLFLAEHPGKVFSRYDLANMLRGSDNDIYSRSIDILVSRLRNKIKPCDPIKTIRSRGYMWSK